MSWIYEVPLPNVHHLRGVLNALPFDKPVDQAVFEPYDPPVLASVLKLWLLELNPPVMMWEGWEEVKKIYPAVGAEKKEQEGDGVGIEEELKNLLARLPTVSVKVLDAVVKHLRECDHGWLWQVIIHADQFLDVSFLVWWIRLRRRRVMNCTSRRSRSLWGAVSLDPVTGQRCMLTDSTWIRYYTA